MDSSSANILDAVEMEIVGDGSRATDCLDPPPPDILEQARLGNLDMFRAELESGNRPLDFKAGDDVYFNRTALHLAAKEGRTEVVEFILSRPGISIDVVNAKDCFGYTPLHLAVRSWKHSVVRLLTKSPLVLPDLFLAASSEFDENRLECGGFTPLHLAAIYGNLEIMKLLVRQPRQREFGFSPVNIYAMSWQGVTPIDLARQQKSNELVEFLEDSDFNLLQQERARNAVSASAILVGAALVAAAAFGAWLQPPAGNSGLPSFSGKNRQWDIAFFNYSAFAFTCAMVSLGLATLASYPFRATSLKSEVKVVRRTVRAAQSFLMFALMFFFYSFSLGASLVLYEYALYGTAVYYVATWLPLIAHLYMLYYFASLEYRTRAQYGLKKQLLVMFFSTIPAYFFIVIRIERTLTINCSEVVRLKLCNKRDRSTQCDVEYVLKFGNRFSFGS